MAGRSALRLRPPNAQEGESAHGGKGRMAGGFGQVLSKAATAVGQENPASGRFDPLQRGSSKAAAPVGRKGPVKVKGHSTKNKAAASEGALEAGKARAELPSEVRWILAREGNVKPDNEGTPLKIYPDEMVAGITREPLPQMVLPPWTPKVRLPKEEVDMILSLEPHRFEPYDEETLRRLFPRESTEETMEIMREGAEASEEAAEKFIQFQNWVRGEMEEKDCVEVPVKFLTDREKLVEWIQEEFDQMFKNLNIPDRYFASASEGEDDH